MIFPVFRNPLEKCVVFTSGFQRFSPVFTAGFHGRLPWGSQPQRTVYRQAEPSNPSEKNVAPSVTAAIMQDQSAGGNVANSPPPPTEAMLIFFWKVVPQRGTKRQHCLWGTGEFFFRTMSGATSISGRAVPCLIRLQCANRRCTMWIIFAFGPSAMPKTRGCSSCPIWSHQLCACRSFA